MFKLGVFAALLALLACDGSDASSSTTASTLQIAPPTTADRSSPAATTTIATTTVPPTTTLASTTAPPSTTMEDQLAAAVDRAGTAMRNCYLAAPELCDARELESALVGQRLDRWLEISEETHANGEVNENAAQWSWYIIEGPTLKGNDLAIVLVCIYDPIILRAADGSVIDGEMRSSSQEWQLFPVADTWKVGSARSVANYPDKEGCG